MATTQNTYTGNGSTTAYSFTFPYIETTDIKVSLDGVDTTAYTLSNATTVTFNTAPTNGAAIRIYRTTFSDNLKATFYPGSAIKSSDLNDNFTQNLYVTQESTTTADSASTVANAASTTATTAQTTADAATITANTAVTTANGAVATANAASAAIGAVIPYTPIAALANLPTSPSNQDRVEVANSTGVESSGSVSGVPAGFVGSTDLTVRLQYNSSTSLWEWQQYFASDPESRYVTSYLPVIKGDGTTSGQVGKITLNCSNNNHGVSISSPPHSAAATYNLVLPNDTGTSGEFLATNGTGTLSWSNALSGTPTAPTAAQGTNTTQIATTAFVNTEITSKAPIASPTFTGTVTIPSGAVIADYAKLNAAQTYTAEQTFGELKETVFTLGTTGTIAIDPANGSIQRSVLSGAPTFSDSLDSGQTVVLHLENGSSYTIGWPTITWVTSAGNTAPTLTAKDTFVFWKISTTLYGAYVGSYV